MISLNERDGVESAIRISLNDYVQMGLITNVSININVDLEALAVRFTVSPDFERTRSWTIHLPNRYQTSFSFEVWMREVLHTLTEEVESSIDDVRGPGFMAADNWTRNQQRMAQAREAQRREDLARNMAVNMNAVRTVPPDAISTNSLINWSTQANTTFSTVPPLTISPQPRLGERRAEAFGGGGGATEGGFPGGGGGGYWASVAPVNVPPEATPPVNNWIRNQAGNFPIGNKYFDAPVGTVLTTEGLITFLKDSLRISLSVSKSDSDVDVSIELFLVEGNGVETLIASDQDSLSLED